MLESFVAATSVSECSRKIMIRSMHKFGAIKGRSATNDPIIINS